MNRQRQYRSVELHSGPRRAGCATRRLGGATIPLVLLAFSAAAAATYFVAFRKPAEGVNANAILHTVARDDFVLDITERGEVESAGVTEVVSEVKTKNTAGLAILRIVPEGTEVAAGDFLVELDSSALKEEQTAQQILVNTAEALVVEARNIYETALIARQEYLEGTYIQERQTIESEVFVAEENLNRAKEYYAFSKRLAAKGYVNELQLEADKFAVEKSQKELDAANTKLMVLDNFTKAKMLKTLESDIVTAKAKLASEEKSYSLELEKLRDVQDQVAKCMILAPKAGIVTYAHERDRRGDEEFVVEPGAVVRERQAIVRLPDPSRMQVTMSINESMIQYIHRDMPATIKPVGIDDAVLHGAVTKVNQYAEPTGWRQGNVKEYKAFVAINESAPGLRSGMTASVSIQAAHVPNVIQIPVQAVYMHGRDRYCFVSESSGWTARKVECGPTNDKFFIVEAGLDVGEQISMNPRRYVEYVDLPELSVPEDAPADGPSTDEQPDNAGYTQLQRDEVTIAEATNAATVDRNDSAATGG